MSVKTKNTHIHLIIKTSHLDLIKVRNSLFNGRYITHLMSFPQLSCMIKENKDGSREARVRLRILAILVMKDAKAVNCNQSSRPGPLPNYLFLEVRKNLSSEWFYHQEIFLAVVCIVGSFFWKHKRTSQPKFSENFKQIGTLNYFGFLQSSSVSCNIGNCWLNDYVWSKFIFILDFFYALFIPACRSFYKGWNKGMSVLSAYD